MGVLQVYQQHCVRKLLLTRFVKIRRNFENEEGRGGGGWLYSVHFPFWHALVNFSPFAVKLYRCVRGCNSFNDLSKKPCAPNKAEDLNIHVLNINTAMNESKILANHISCESKCKFDGKKFNSNQKWNNHKCRCECKN